MNEVGISNEKTLFKMKKTYICPSTEVYKVNFRDGILAGASQVGDSTYTPGGSSNWDQGGDGGGSYINPDPGSGDVYSDDDLSRRGGGNVWDNIW